MAATALWAAHWYMWGNSWVLLTGDTKIMSLEPLGAKGMLVTQTGGAWLASEAFPGTLIPEAHWRLPSFLS